MISPVNQKINDPGYQYWEENSNDSMDKYFRNKVFHRNGKTFFEVNAVNTIRLH